MEAPGSLLLESTAHTLVAGELRAIFLPGRGMLGASFRHRGEELLGRVENLEAAAAKGSTAGIPFLYPFANRLGGTRYRAAGHEVLLDSTSPLLHLDEHGLPIHGVPWASLSWEVTEATQATLRARLAWDREDLLALFPFRHRVELTVALRSDALRVETTVLANGSDAVPVSFGFHPYLVLPGLGRERWRLTLPAMQRLVLDGRGIPTGQEEPFARLDGPLGARAFDDGFRLLEEPSVLRLTGPDRALSVALLDGYGYAQLFAPRDKAFVALEPMTAPTDALASGKGLRLVEPGGHFRAVFEIGVTASV
jgi:aldose 1-epimerase